MAKSAEYLEHRRVPQKHVAPDRMAGLATMPEEAEREKGSLKKGLR